MLCQWSGPPGFNCWMSFIPGQLFILLSHYLCFIIFISRFVISKRCYIDNLGIFHANQTSICLDPHQKLENLTVLKCLHDLLNNVKVGQCQRMLIIETYFVFNIYGGGGRFGHVT